MNKVILIGNISSNIELRYTGNNKAVATFSLAIPRINDKDNADFLPIVVWGKQAENLKDYQKKGNKILVEGRIQTRNYTDEKGNKHYITEIIAEVVQYLSPKEKGQQEANKEAINEYQDMSIKTESDIGQQIQITDEDLPF